MTADATTATTRTSTRVSANTASDSRSASDRSAGRRGVAIASPPMRAADLPIASSFWNGHRNLIIAVITLVVAFVLAQLVDRAIQSRGERLRAVIPGAPGELSPVASTRLRLVRRLVYAAILVI